MKTWTRLAALVSVLAATPALATGKITIKPKYDVDSHDVQWNLGLPIYERFMSNVAYVSWTGAGLMPIRDESWMKTEQGFEAYFKALSVGLGASYEYTPANKQAVKQVYSTLGVTLW